MSLNDDKFDKGVRSGVSDPLDKALGWAYDNPKEDSKVRGAVHGTYHAFQGAKEYMRGNEADSDRQFERSKEQFGKGW